MIKKKYNPLYAMLLSLLIFLLVCYVVDIWPFGDKTIVTGDLGGQYINFYSHFSNAIKAGDWGGLIYGFDKSLGGTLIGNLAYYCMSIFNVIYLFITPDKYPLAVTFILLLKLMCMSASMCFFIDKRYEDIGVFSIILSLCYTYCAFSTVYYQNIMWFDAMIFLPLIANSIHDMVYNKTGYHVYILCLAVTIISNFYTGYMVCLFCVLFFFYELFLNSNSSEVFNNCVDFGISSLCAGGLSAFIVIPMLFDVSKAKGLTGSIAVTELNSFKLSEFFYRLFPFNFTWNDIHDGLPNVYTGMLCILGLAWFITSKNIKIKEKLVSITVLAVLFISMYSYDFMLLWHGMKEPVWFPYRNSFLFSFFVCVLAAKALQKMDLSNRTIIFTALLIGILSVQAFLIRNIWFTLTLLCIGIIFIGIQRILFILHRNNRYKRILARLLTIVCLIELASNASFTINQFENYSYSYLSDFYTNTKDLLNNLSDSGIYTQRVEKTFFRTYNDPMMFGYPGITHFGSTEDDETNVLLKNLGFIDEAYSGQTTAFADSFLGIGNLIGKNGDRLPEHFTIVRSDKNGIIAENEFVFPMVFRVNETDLQIRLKGDNTFEIQNQLFNMLGGEGKLFVQNDADVYINGDGHICTHYDDNIYNYLLVRKYVNEKEEISYIAYNTLVDNTVIFDTAVFENADNVELWQMNKQKLADLSAELQEKAGDTHFNANRFSSVIKGDNGLVVINVPHSEFLKVTVDGEYVESTPVLGGLTGIYVDEDAHSIQISGRLQGGTLGITISIISIMIFICFVYYKRKKQ